MYRFLRSHVRMVGLALPEELKGKFPRILCGANPGNVGHAFVKSSFIDGALPLEVRRMPEEEGGMLRQYIPARLDNNPSMLTDDPGYEAKLSGMGSAELVRAMREGDWNTGTSLSALSSTAGATSATRCGRSRSRRTGCASARWTGSASP
jgi:hypothetical protein